MSLIDVTTARQVLEDFLYLLAEHKKYDDAVARKGGHHYEGDERAKRAHTNQQLTRHQHLIEEIAHAIDPGEAPDRFKENSAAYAWGWGSAYTATERLLGILDKSPIREQIFGPKGPALDAERLHPWVWHSAVNRWDSGFYKDAVTTAAATVEQKTQVKLGRSDLHGTQLYSQAFSIDSAKPGEPRLRFEYISETTEDGEWTLDWKSAHLGARSFGQGCAQGIRNLQAHGTKDLAEQEALEYLAALSVLARWVDSATVQKAPSTP